MVSFKILGVNIVVDPCKWMRTPTL